MKRIIYLLTTILILSSCSQNNNEENKKKISNEKPKVKNELTLKDSPIEYKFEKGNYYEFNLATITHSSQTMKTDSLIENSSNQTVSYKINVNVEKLNKDTSATLKINVKEIAVNGNLNGQNFHYNSSEKMSKKEKKPFLDYEAVVNKKFKINIAPNGTVKKIFNVEKITNALIKNQGRKNISISERLSFIKTVKNTVISPLIKQVFRELPTNEVNIDSTWNEIYDVPLAVYQVKNIAIFRVDHFEKFTNDTLANISASLKIQYSGNNTSEKDGIQYTFSEPKVHGQGYINFNLSKGLVQKSETTTRMQMSTMLVGNGPKGNKLTAVQTDITTTTNVVELKNYKK